jgi:hypothetical protein
MAFSIFFVQRWRGLQLKKRDIIDTPTSKIASLTSAPPPPGSLVEIKGRVVSKDGAMRAPYSGINCAFYCAQTMDKIKRVTPGKRKQRKSVDYFHSVTEELTSDNRPFYVEDATGRITVDPAGMTIEGRQVFYRETPVYAIGELFDGEDGPVLRLPINPDATRLVSYKTEEVLLSEIRRTEFFLFIGWLLVMLMGTGLMSAAF